MGKQFATVFWLGLLAVWFGTYKFLQYKVDMYYSNLAPQQFEDDGAYSKLQTHGTVDNIILLVFLVGTSFCVYRIVKVWSAKKVATKS